MSLSRLPCPTASFQINSPPAHHLAPPPQPFGGIVHAPDTVIRMSELHFNPVPIEMVFVQDSRRSGTKSVDCSPAVVTHPVKREQERVLGYDPCLCLGRKENARDARMRPELAQNVHSLRRERHKGGAAASSFVLPGHATAAPSRLDLRIRSISQI